MGIPKDILEKVEQDILQKVTAHERDLLKRKMTKLKVAVDDLSKEPEEERDLKDQLAELGDMIYDSKFGAMDKSSNSPRGADRNSAGVSTGGDGSRRSSRRS